MEEDKTDTLSTNSSKAGCQEMSQGHDWVLRDRRIHYQYLSIHLLQQKDKKKSIRLNKCWTISQY